MRWSTLVIGALFVFACAPDIEIDSDEFDGPTVEFDLDSSVVPFPSNRLLNPANGKVALPQQCNETPASTDIRMLQLNVLDGFGTWKTPIRIAFSETPDRDNLAANILLFRRSTGGDLVDPDKVETIGLTLFLGTTLRYDNGCTEDPVKIDSVTAVPNDLLREGSTYTVVVFDRGDLQDADGKTIKLGILTKDGGEAFKRSSTWALISQIDKPVTVINGDTIIDHNTPLDPLDADEKAQLLDIDLLWRAHAGTLAYVDKLIGDGIADPVTRDRVRDRVLGVDSKLVPRERILLAWDFTTQTITSPLDASVPGSPAAVLPKNAIAALDTISRSPDGMIISVLSFLEDELDGVAACAAVGCAAVGDVLGGALVNIPNYSTKIDNSLPGGTKLPGAWTDPLSPDEISNTPPIMLIAFVPAAPPTTGAAGYPTVIFGHGIARSKEDLFAIGSQLAANGFASVALDWVNHGDRAVQITAEPSIGCSGTPLPTSDQQPQCFESIFSADLAATRDNLRQSALDASAIVEALKACGDTKNDGLCPGLEVDATRIGYLGQSMGTFIGALTVAMNDDIGAAVLNVGGAGLIDFIENTDSLSLRCGIVNALIDAETLPSPPYTKSNLTFTSGTCTDPTEFAALKIAPEWRSSTAVARWILASGDSVNYASGLNDKRILIQEVVGDVVVPNMATSTLATFAGLTPDPAVCATATPATSTSLDFTVKTEGWIQYRTLPIGTAGCADGATFSHDSLLEHTDTSVPAQLATAQMQADAIAFLKASLLEP